MNFPTYLKQSAQAIESELQIQLQDWRGSIAASTEKLLPLADLFIKACQGGKRLRGTLVILGYELAANQTVQSRIFRPAAAFEIFQTAILSHDDVIDLSPLRRGQPTIFQSLGSDHFAISQTICLGDIGFFLALKLIADSDFPDQPKNIAIQSFCASMLETATGQMMDVLMPRLSDKSEEDAITVFRLKTARYTISGPMQLGAILAGSNQKLLANIQKFGDNLGIAFQIQDDILGVFGDEQTLGKSVTSDVEEGKSTLLITYALEHADKKQTNILSRYYGHGKISEKELSWIKQTFIDVGALEYSQKRAHNYINIAKKVTPEITADPKYQQLLNELADFLVQRNR